MKEIYPNLYVGSQDDYEYSVRGQDGWAVVHACKEPYHRQALGYTGQGAPKNHPEYLIARRGNRLILNLVDANDPAYIPKQIMDAALEFLHEQLNAGSKALVHCNQGGSRAPAIGLLYLAKFTDKLPTSGFPDAENAFRSLYPLYNPAPGVRGFLVQNWSGYTTNS
ncbi:MAG: protein-tyrosine phosphatase family protein [Aggregatilineales bacterium]